MEEEGATTWAVVEGLESIGLAANLLTPSIGASLFAAGGSGEGAGGAALVAGALPPL